MSRKRASGPVRARVLAALRAAVDERGPGCFASQRAAAEALAADLGLSFASVRRAIQYPQTAAEAAAIEAAIQPRSPFACELGPGTDAAGFGGAPVSAPGAPPSGAPGAPEVRQGEPVLAPSVSSDASSQVSPGAPSIAEDGASRAREPRCSLSPAPLCPPTAATDSPAAPASGPAAPQADAPFSTTLACWPWSIRPSRFPGECLFCGCPLEEGEALILTPYLKQARMFCADDAEDGLWFAQREWLLAGREIPKRRDRKRTPKPPTTPTPDPQE